MEVKDAIKKRRAYRSLEPVEVTKEIIKDFAECAQITASCFNNQPWRFIFVYDSKMLEKMHNVLTSGNEWAYKASMIIVVLGKQEDDCVIHDRIYYRFDIGMAVSAMILRATELDLVAHPIAGYSPRKTRELLGIPDDFDVITLIIVGKKSVEINPVLSEKQIQNEKKRPKRLSIDDFIYYNKFKEK
jgi:nitroreductase